MGSIIQQFKEQSECMTLTIWWPHKLFDHVIYFIHPSQPKWGLEAPWQQLVVTLALSPTAASAALASAGK